MTAHEIWKMELVKNLTLFAIHEMFRYLSPFDIHVRQTHGILERKFHPKVSLSGWEVLDGLLLTVGPSLGR